MFLPLLLAAAQPSPPPPVRADARMRILDAARASERNWRDGNAERQRERVEVNDGKRVLLRLTEFE